MGRKVSDGKAFDVVMPTGQVINDYDLYRVGGVNGVAIGTNDGVAIKAMSVEADVNAVYSVKVPAGIAPVPGDFGYWATNDSTTFQRGDTNLTLQAASANGQSPCVIFLTSKNAAGYCNVRVIQSSVNKFGT